MSGIPQRLWRIVKGHRMLASEKAEVARARADAIRELEAAGGTAAERARQAQEALARREARAEVGSGDLAAVEERIRRTRAEAEAYTELSDHLKRAELPRPTSSGRLPPVPAAPRPAPAAQPPAPAPPPAPTPAGRPARQEDDADPLLVCYELLGVQPGADLFALEQAYHQRLAETPVDAYPEGSVERELQECRRRALAAAYERLKDVLHPTRSRFGKIEF